MVAGWFVGEARQGAGVSLGVRSVTTYKFPDEVNKDTVARCVEWGKANGMTPSNVARLPFTVVDGVIEVQEFVRGTDGDRVITDRDADGVWHFKKVTARYPLKAAPEAYGFETM